MRLRNSSLFGVAIFMALSSSSYAQQQSSSPQTTTQTPAAPPTSTSPQTATPQPPSTPTQQPVQDRTPPAIKPGNAQPPAPSSNTPAPANSSPQTTPATTSPPAQSSPPVPLPSSSTPAVPLKPVISTGTSLVTPTQTSTVPAPLTRDEAVRLALGQASTFQQAGLNERIAAEDVRQARAAFLPRVAVAPSVIYTTPSIGNRAVGDGVAPDVPRAPSFIAANAVSEFQALANVTGELDVSGRLRATLNRNVALLEAARAGTEVARRTLVQAIDDAYFGLALAAARRGAAEQNLAAAAEFERATQLLLSAGEVAPVDLTRARLQTNTRRDELEQARTSEAVAADSLRVFVGYDFNQPIATTDLLTEMPQPGEVESFTADAIQRRPELAQFDAERRAAELDIRLARNERRPQVTYNISGGFDSDSLRPPRIGQHAGASAAIGVSIPIFDAGISRSRERQAQLRAQVAQSSRLATLRSFAQSFYSARTQAFSAEARIRLASVGIRDAESNLAASLARYRAGEASIIEVTDAQNQLITQRTNFYQAIFDYQTARARLLQATGR